MLTPNKFKSTRKVTFTDDYYSGPQKAAIEKKQTVAPVYKKGSVHYIHNKTVEALKDKGAKMKVENFDYEAYVKKSQKQKAENEKRK